MENYFFSTRKKMAMTCRVILACLVMIVIEVRGSIIVSQFTSPERLYSAQDLNSSITTQTPNIVFSRAPRITGITSDPFKHTLFLYSAVAKKLEMIPNFSGTLGSSSDVQVIRTGVSNVYGSVAFDWITENLYWTDNNYNWIAMQPAYLKDETMYKIIVHKDLYQPEGLTIDPEAGYLFWSDNANTNRIERSLLSGKNRTILVYRAVRRVMSLTTDPDSRTLYWVDLTRLTLESCDYTGSNRRVLRSLNGWSPRTLAIFQDKILVTIKEGKIYLYDKKTGYYQRSIKVDSPHAIYVYNASQQNKQLVTNHCGTANCPHMCVNTHTGNECICKEGFQFYTMTKTCNATTDYFDRGLIVTDGTKICMMRVEATTGHQHTYRCRNFGRVLVGAVTVSKDKIFFFDVVSRSINMTLLVDMSTSYTVLVDAGSISEMVYDWIEEKLLWIDNASSSIKMMTGDGTQLKTIYRNLGNPRSLTVDPHKKEFYWTSGNSDRGMIFKSSMSGGVPNALTVLQGAVSNAKAVFFDSMTDKLFWIGNGQLQRLSRNQTVVENLGNVTADDDFLLIYQDYAIWASTKPTLHAKRVEKKAKKINSQISNLTSIIDISVFDVTQMTGKRGTCPIDNGKCEQICIPGTPEPSCLCELGFTLQVDNMTCSSVLLRSEFGLITDATHNRIYQTTMDGKSVRGLKIEGIDNPLSSRYHPRQQKIYIAQYSRRITSASLDGRNTSAIYTTGSVYPSSIALDFSTDYLYYTAPRYKSAITESYVGVLRLHHPARKMLVSGLGDPRSIAVHPGKGLIFWTDVGNSSHIGRSFMDGSSKQFIITTDIKWPMGIAVDYSADRLYWGDGSKNKIEYCDFSGANRKILLSDPKAFITDIAIKGAHIFYTAWHKRRVTKANKNSGQIIEWMDEIPEFGRLDSIDLYPPDAQPDNMLCKDRNGECSTFCLLSSVSRVCSCEDGVDLAEDGKRCRNVEVCKGDVRNGTLDPNCLRYANERCDFKCDEGFESRTGSYSVMCGILGRWTEDVDTLCQGKRKDVEQSGVQQRERPIVLYIIISVGVTALVVFGMMVVVLAIRKKQRRYQRNTTALYERGGNIDIHCFSNPCEPLYEHLK